MRLTVIRHMGGVAAIVGFLSLTSPASAQQNTLFGSNGALSGPNGFGNQWSSPSFRDRGAANGLTIQTSPYPNRLFDRQRGSAFGSSGLTRRAAGADAGIQIPGSVITERPQGLFCGAASGNGAASPFSSGTERSAVNRRVRQVELDDGTTTVESDETSELDGAPVNGNANPGRNSIPRGFRSAEESPSGGVVETNSTTRALSGNARLRGVTLTLIDGVWTLQGRVPSAETRRLAAMYASLQPGIGQVRNEITVGSAP